MTVQVDDARHDGLAREVDDFGLARHLDPGRWSDVTDFAAGENEGCVFYGASACAVDEADVLECDDLCCKACRGNQYKDQKALRKADIPVSKSVNGHSVSGGF